MAIVRWTPGRWFGRDYFNDIENMRSQMMNLFDTLSNPGSGSGLSTSGVFPTLNIYEDEDKLYITAELPGISTNDLNIIVENDKLTIRGERKILEKDKKLNIHRQERESGFFRRIINLPTRIDANKVSAVTKDGILEITLPKALEAKPRQIAVQAI
jgi:HSP20 family protein